MRKASEARVVPPYEIRLRDSSGPQFVFGAKTIAAARALLGKLSKSPLAPALAIFDSAGTLVPDDVEDDRRTPGA
jgi:hypothetical protein